MEVIDTTLEVNKFARRSRHLRIFSKIALVRMHTSDLLKYSATPIKVLGGLPFVSHIRRFLIAVKLLVSDVVPVSPQKKLVFQASLIAITTLVVTSLTPGGTLSAASMDYATDYIGAYSLPGDVLVSDDNGYLIKINPQTTDTSRIGMTDYAVHTIEDGESLSVIAQRYGVSVETIMWENNLPNANSIRAGQKLLVPPVDGVSYDIASGDTLDKVAKKYNITKEAIIAQNALDGETLVKGQSIFLPGAKIIAPVNTVASNYRVSSVTRDARTYSNSTNAPAVGRVFIYPTKGKITNGYHSGHYAIDIADSSQPPIWAAGAGTIEKVVTGCNGQGSKCGGGYGNHVIIDHGNGLKTLYGHFDSVDVSVGQWVNQGDVLGIMGNTGRVYGVTGIHLHWEVIQDGVKEYPGDYY